MMFIVELLYRDGFRLQCLVPVTMTVADLMAQAAAARPGVKLSGYRLRRPR